MTATCNKIEFYECLFRYLWIVFVFLATAEREKEKKKLEGCPNNWLSSKNLLQWNWTWQL